VFLKHNLIFFCFFFKLRSWKGYLNCNLPDIIPSLFSLCIFVLLLANFSPPKRAESDCYYFEVIRWFTTVAVFCKFSFQNATDPTGCPSDRVSGCTSLWVQQWRAQPRPGPRHILLLFSQRFPQTLIVFFSFFYLPVGFFCNSCIPQRSEWVWCSGRWKWKWSPFVNSFAGILHFTPVVISLPLIRCLCSEKGSPRQFGGQVDSLSSWKRGKLPQIYGICQL